MDQRTWLWRKRSLEKSTAESNDTESSENEEEKLRYEKEAALERSVKNLHEKVASLLCECNAKDNLVAEHAKTAQEATAARDKAEAEMAICKQELEEALQQRAAANERLVHLNAALKDCRQQLSSLKEEQDQRVNQAVKKVSQELEWAYKRLEEKFTETSKKLANVTVENAQLSKALVMKEELIEDVSNQMSQATMEFNALISRLDSTEKENNILKYEYQVLERELEIQNRCADVANRQHQESAKRAAKLEAECQRLRSLVRKRIPGPTTASAKVKREVESNHPEAVARRMSFMIKRLCEVEEENKILKESAYKKDHEMHVLQKEFAQMRCDESNSRNAAHYKMIDYSDMSLMDDFVEMEKLAIVSVDAHSSDANNPDSGGKELVPVTQGDEINSSAKDCDWLQSVLKEIMEQNHASERSFDELLEDIRIALQCRYQSSSTDDPISGYITWKHPNTSGSSLEENEGSMNKLNDLESVHKDLEAKLLESEKSIGSLKSELENLKESNKMAEDQYENQKLINEDLDHQLSMAKVQINEALQKVSSLEVELEERSHCCEELEATCLELQLQLASVSSRVVEEEDAKQEEKLLQTGWEITAASAKLAECQETIFSLGRQLKALTTTKEAVVLTSNKMSRQHLSLHDHMAAENGADSEELLNSPKTKEIISTAETKEPSILHSGSYNSSYGVKSSIPGAMAIVTSKKRGKGTELLRKLLFRRKRGSGKKKLLTFAT